MSRELDERVAKAMGWHWDDDWGCLIPPEQKATPGEMWTGWHRDHDDDVLHREPAPGAAFNRIVYNGNFTKIILPEVSTDWAAAWQVVEWMAENRGHGFFLIQDWHGPVVAMSGYYKASFIDQEHWANAASAPEAICRAFLAAMEATCDNS